MRCTARSCKNEAEEPFRRCPACREAARAARRATRQKDPEKARRKGRECAARRRERPSPAALAHAERNRAARYAATSAWAARNPEKKARTGRLAALIHAGRIVKPAACEDCRLPKKPLVAWGVEKDAEGKLSVQGWTCWRCRNERLRQSAASPVLAGERGEDVELLHAEADAVISDQGEELLARPD